MSVLGPNSEILFETPRVSRSVLSSDFRNRGSGTYQADFFSIEHSSGIQLLDEFILSARGGAEENIWNYTLHPIRSVTETTPGSSPKKIQAHSISNNIFVALVQFDEPFGYSTTSWVKDNNCLKDFGKFRQVLQKQPGPAQKVKAEIKVSEDTKPYEYLLKSLLNPPFMKFIIPGQN